MYKNSLKYIRRWINNNIKDHPPQSPDLNRTEFVWKKLKDLVELRRPRSKEDLREAILTSWDEISISFVRNNILGLTNKLTQTIRDAEEKLVIEDDENSYENGDNSNEEPLEADYDSLSDVYDDEESDNDDDDKGIDVEGRDENNVYEDDTEEFQW